MRSGAWPNSTASAAPTCASATACPPPTCGIRARCWKSKTRRPPCPMPTACRPCQNRAIAQTSENTMGFLQGKRALITGIASQRSIATGIAEPMHRQGAELALTYQTETLRSTVEDAAKEYGPNIGLQLDEIGRAACREKVWYK